MLNITVECLKYEAHNQDANKPRGIAKYFISIKAMC